MQAGNKWATVFVAVGLFGKAIYDASVGDFNGMMADIVGAFGTLGLSPLPSVAKVFKAK